ncbi:MAG: 2OG-Fe(II) oxygenase [Burkholderiaceae bacterium]|nr:2OG-Fe(II) oxygenase [Burkholderiaceae bacterium]
MNKIHISLPGIYRYDNVLDKQSCKKLHNFIIQTCGLSKNYNPTLMPWDENDKIQALNIKDIELKNIILEYREKVTNIVYNCYKTICWPEQTDLVLWRTNRQHTLHEDDPSKIKVFSTITYLNSGFLGGETYLTLNGKEYWNKPKSGSIIIYPSETIHGVPIISKGIKTTLGIWFCTDPNFKENFN